MIEQDVYVYFKQDATLSGYLGGNEKIYLISAPTEDSIKLPWVVIEQTSGFRTKISQTKMEEIGYLRISVDAGPDEVFGGRDIIERCKKLLENYRGNLDQAKDVYSTTSAIRGWAGLGNSYRYQFDATVRFTEAYTRP
jgi:hypothetical protein